MKPLKLETKEQRDETPVIGNMIVTPPIEEGYWKYRVKLSDKQAIVGFPKFFTIGIGFEVETDWNTNLPYTCDAQRIFDHIKHNKGNKKIKDADCIRAIELIQKAAAKDESQDS